MKRVYIIKQLDKFRKDPDIITKYSMKIECFITKEIFNWENRIGYELNQLTNFSKTKD